MQATPRKGCRRSDAHLLQVFDRPQLQRKRPKREYVQPQWVVDSANFRVLVDARLYAPGVAPPPHLSPFVDNDEEGYVPEYAGVLQKMQVIEMSLEKIALENGVQAALH